ncbi:MAG: hypothetical protein LUI09_06560 [Prevotellaceae bacterium]|nr:hypothetical protein [Prevotellaceae bacterium]
MKHSITALLICLLACSCSASRHATGQGTKGQDTLTYSYSQTQSLTQKDVQFFNRVSEAYGGLQYTPIWLTTSEEGESTLLSYFCNGQNGKPVMVTIEKPQHGKPVIKEIKQVAKPRKPTNVVTVYYDPQTGSAPLEAVLSTQDCEVMGRDPNACSVTLRLKKSETRTLLENTKGVLSVTDHQIMSPYPSND